MQKQYTPWIVVCRAIFISSDRFMTHISEQEVWSTLLHSHASLHLCTGLWKSQHSFQLDYGLQTSLLFIFSHSVGGLLRCLGSLSCCVWCTELPQGQQITIPSLPCSQLVWGLCADMQKSALWSHLFQKSLFKCAPPCCHVVFRERRLSPAAMLFQSFSPCTVMNFNL